MLVEPLRARGPATLADVAASIGTRAFGPRLAAYADAAFGGHVVFAYHHQGGEMQALAAGHVPPDPTNVLVPNTWRYTRQREWERDACLAQTMTLAEGHAGPVQFHDQGGAVSRRHWPWQIPTPLVDKLLQCHRSAEGDYVLAFSRWGDIPGFSAAAAEQAEEAGRLLMSLLVAHRRLLVAVRDPRQAFGSPAEIEHCLARTTPLSPRERQVCALFLQGLSGARTATELGIEAESVKSYRKRAYLRLGVNCERELLLRYLSLRATWEGRGHDLDAAPDPWRMPFLLSGSQLDAQV